MERYLKPLCETLEPEIENVLCSSSDFNDYMDGIYDGDGIVTP